MTHYYQDTFRASPADISAFSEEIAGGQIVRFEDFSKDIYLDAVIEKPWGHEYRVYADMLVDIWKLFLAPGQSTSMHSHPRKETVLMCLGGQLRINFLGHAILVNSGELARIPKGVFHSTDNIGQTDAHLIEVETPRNKFDLIRRKDRYGRQGKQYETKEGSREIADLVNDPLMPYAKVRSRDIDGIFSFELTSGREIVRNSQRIEFSVSLSLEAALNQKIDVQHRNSDEFTSLKLDSPYLAIGRI